MPSFSGASFFFFFHPIYLRGPGKESSKDVSLVYFFKHKILVSQITRWADLKKVLKTRE